MKLGSSLMVTSSRRGKYDADEHQLQSPEAIMMAARVPDRSFILIAARAQGVASSFASGWRFLLPLCRDANRTRRARLQSVFGVMCGEL